MAEGSPERSSDVLGGVNSQTVDSELLYEGTDPSVVCADDSGVFGVDVGKSDFGITEPALLDAGVVAVVDGAVVVILGC